MQEGEWSLLLDPENSVSIYYYVRTNLLGIMSCFLEDIDRSRKLRTNPLNGSQLFWGAGLFNVEELSCISAFTCKKTDKRGMGNMKAKVWQPCFAGEE